MVFPSTEQRMTTSVAQGLSEGFSAIMSRMTCCSSLLRPGKDTFSGSLPAPDLGSLASVAHSYIVTPRLKMSAGAAGFVLFCRNSGAT